MTTQPNRSFTDFLEAREYHKALTWAERNLAHSRSTFGERHPETAHAANRIGVALHHTHGAEAASLAYTEALEFAPPTAHEVNATILWNLAEIAVMQRQPDQARTYLRRTQKHLDQADDSPAILLVATHSLQADAEVIAEDFAAAESSILKALAVQKRLAGSDFGSYHAELLLGQLATIHELTGNVDAAATLRAKLTPTNQGITNAVS